MVGCVYRVMPVLCSVLFQVALARRLEEWPADWGGGLIRPTLPPLPPTDDNRTVKASRDQTIFLDKTIREISEDLYEGDVVLTQEQKLLLQERKATNPAFYWPKDSDGNVTVGYRFGDTIINKALLKVAIAHWETNTCIRFKEVSRTVGYVHLKFVNAGYCASYVGRISTMTTGQTIWLYPTCISEIGPAVHEIGHALGFNHEQSRSDRDDHVQVMWNNIEAGKEGNFNKEVTYNYGVPYDYWSVMHYGPNYFTSNGQNTLLAFNPIAQPLMGNRIGLSFADKLMANTMYGCIGKWLTQCSLSIDPSKNMGYTGPACSCVCPEGTSSSNCEVLLDSYTDALIKLKTPYSETITSPGTVSTPGYPTPIQTRMAFVKILVAPICYQVKLTIHDFDVYQRYTDGTCAIDALIVRTQDALGTGVTYCGKEIAPGTLFISGNNTIVLDYYNYDYTTLTWSSPYRGFNATVEHILSDGCNATAPPATTPPDTTPPVTTPPATTQPTNASPATTPPVTTPPVTTPPTTTPPATIPPATTPPATTPPITTPPTTTPPTTTPPTTTPPTTTPPTTTPPVTTPPATTPPSTSPAATTTITTPSTPPAVTIINSGDIPLTVSTFSSGLCTLNNTSTSGSYKLTSSRYPSKYGPGDSCNVNLRTSEPRYLKVTTTSILTTPGEIIYMKGVFNLATSIYSRGSGQSYLFPSSTTSMLFTPIAQTLGKTFVLGLQVQNSDCHQVIKVDAGATGILTKTNYASITICEWWIQAPPGMEIQLAFSAFNVGMLSCANDFLGIDTSGDPLYKSASNKYCGTTSPKTVTSSGGQMNVLLKGIQGGYPGFIASYSVV